MKNLILVALTAALLLVAAPIEAKATAFCSPIPPPLVTEFTGTETLAEILDEGTVIPCCGGRTHIRGIQAVDREEADDLRWTGFATVYANANLDANGVARWWGTWTMTPDEPLEGGSWEGTFTGKTHADGSRSFRCWGYGTEDFEGLKVFIAIEYPPPPEPQIGIVTGRIFEPYGG